MSHEDAEIWKYDPNTIWWCDSCYQYFELGELLESEGDDPCLLCPKCRGIVKEWPLDAVECY